MRKLTLEERIARLEKFIKNEDFDEPGEELFADLDMEDGWPLVEAAIKEGDVRALNKYAREGNFEYYQAEWVVNKLIDNHSDLATTKAACKIISRIIKIDPDQALFPKTIRNLNRTDNEYLINFLVNNGFLDNIVGAGPRKNQLSPLVIKVLQDNGIDPVAARKKARAPWKGYDYIV